MTLSLIKISSSSFRSASHHGKAIKSASLSFSPFSLIYFLALCQEYFLESSRDQCSRILKVLNLLGDLQEIQIIQTKELADV